MRTCRGCDPVGRGALNELIHGAKDARVNVRESEQMVEALRRAGKDVRHLVLPDEGHRRPHAVELTGPDGA